ncbi:Solute carrier family 35 member G1 [Orchesella cincta]|uniref:Solute carrier family 35 member G1 n=1 Tax=Orchesella cincta TaxID=48709 RepID=A0A1D2N7E7_ORCCI|nr:Solute carrier family 35 member G1 [Orchesella cincta]
MGKEDIPRSEVEETEKFISPSNANNNSVLPNPDGSDDNQSPKNNNNLLNESSSSPVYNHNHVRRKSSTHSILESAHVQLQIFVADAKEELKELKQFKKNGKEKTIRTGWKRYIGIILAIMSSMVFALGVLIVKSLPQYHPYSVSFWRFQGVLLPTLPMVFYYRFVKKEPIFDSICPATAPGHLKTIILLFFRGVTGASAVTLQFYSLQFISMADSSVIAFSTPVFVSLASHVFLGEKSGFVPVISGVITLLGVGVITRPPLFTGESEFDRETLIGAGLALGCMVLATATFLLLRYLRQLHFSLITVIFGFWGSFQSLALSASISKFQPPEGVEHWMMAIGLASVTFIGQTCITLAFKFEQAGTVSLCRTCDVLFAYLWQFVFLGVVPDAYSLVGGVIVILGVLVIAFRKFLSELPPDHRYRQRFWILLK